MCLLAVAWRAHEEFQLVVVANRDEFYSRPAMSAHFWHEYPNIFAGRDLKSNGTWLGVSKEGRFAAITNFRDPSKHETKARSRGKLVSEFLHTDSSLEDYCQFIQQQAHIYNGFNLLLCDGLSLMYFSNRAEEPKVLNPGVYALSNAFLNTPWPKTLDARDKLENWLRHPSGIENLSQLLFDSKPADDEYLPDTGISYEMEKALSSQLIQLDDYGTRSSTALIVDDKGSAEYYECVLKPDWETRFHHFESFW